MKFKAFAVIPRAGEIEIKPLVQCKDCQHFGDSWGIPMCCLHAINTPGGEWFCADGEKNGEKGEEDDKAD